MVEPDDQPGRLVVARSGSPRTSSAAAGRGSRRTRRSRSWPPPAPTTARAGAAVASAGGVAGVEEAVERSGPAPAPARGPSSSGTSSTMCTNLAGSVIGSLSLVELALVPTVRTGRDDNAATVPLCPIRRPTSCAWSGEGSPTRGPRPGAADAGLHEVRDAVPRGHVGPAAQRSEGALHDAHPLPDRDAWELRARAVGHTPAYREERYAAIALASHRLYRAHQDPATLPLYRHLVVTRCLVGPRRPGRDPRRRPDPGRARRRGDPADPRLVGRRRHVAAAYGRSSASCTARPARTSTCSRGRWRRTSRAAATAASSSSARRSGGRCASTPASTPTGCGPSSPSTRRGCPACRGREALKHL